jgi:ribose 5-phosphate isomerase B
MALTIAVGGDHAGYQYKQNVITLLQQQGHTVQDFGPESAAAVDYPDHVHPLANAVEKKEADFGILICGSGNGVAITANKHPQVRAALCWLPELAQLARSHNDANILCIPARFITEETAHKMVREFLHTPFEGGRHQTRVSKITC